MTPGDLRLRLAVLVCGALFAVTTGCGDEGEEPADTGTDERSGPCDDYTPDSYVVGLSRTGDLGAFSVRFVDALPAPPDRGDNTFTLELLDSDGAPVSGASLVLEPRMPQHGHGTTPATFDATPADADGTYSVGPMDLFMPGYWEIHISITGPGDSVDETMFSFCLEG